MTPETVWVPTTVFTVLVGMILLGVLGLMAELIKEKREKGHKVSTYVIPISRLKADPANARRHGPKSQAMSKASLEAFGGARSVVIDGEGKVVAGNQTLQSAIEAGIERVVVVESDGSTLTAVCRPDWDAATATAYSLGDNAVSDAPDSVFDPDAFDHLIEELKTDGYPVEELGWDFGTEAVPEEPPPAVWSTDHSPEPLTPPPPKPEPKWKAPATVPADRYEWAVGVLNNVRDDLGLASPSESLIYLLRAYAAGAVQYDPAPGSGV